MAAIHLAPQPFTSCTRFSRRRTAAACAAMRLPVTKPTLVDVPVSNHGARVRHIIYHKGLENEFDIVSPGVFGGLNSEQYLALNAQGKMPLLLLPTGQALPESEVIAQYVLDKYSSQGPSMMAADPESRAIANLAARIHDQYITPIQACLYRKFEAPERASMLAQLVKQLDVLEGLCVGPYFAGPEVTAADSALMPTFVFLTFILPRYFGWSDVFSGRPKLAAWWARLQQDAAAKKVMDEVTGGLESWASKNRWEDLGIVQQACLYCKFEAPERASMLAQLVKELDVLESLCVGPYFAGPEVTAADSALMPTLVFLTFILPRYFGWSDVFPGRPKLAAWWARLQQDAAAKKVMDEVTGGLESWASKNWWEDLGIVQQVQQHKELQWVY